ncbi:hypothetical protein TrVE_jg14167 [Triparma verrucosa]|uniref:Uncharacterized protein n=1 Tax=Triparma verrucosa TaxID=1606542 RepID=A0A9W7F0T3_9STRA|nr:hypothetical protein TrVE_jg14167 [Triparma verrucosa]
MFGWLRGKSNSRDAAVDKPRRPTTTQAKSPDNHSRRKVIRNPPGIHNTKNRLGIASPKRSPKQMPKQNSVSPGRDKRVQREREERVKKSLISPKKKNDDAEVHRQIMLTASIETELTLASEHFEYDHDDDDDDDDQDLPPMGVAAKTPPRNSVHTPTFGLSGRPKVLKYTPNTHTPNRLSSSQRKANRRNSIESAEQVMKLMGGDSAKKARAFRRRSVGAGDDYKLDVGLGEIGQDIGKRTPTSTQKRKGSRTFLPSSPSSHHLKRQGGTAKPRTPRRSDKGKKSTEIARARGQLHPPPQIDRQNSIVDSDHHHIYPPRLLTDIFASHEFLNSTLPGVPGCLRCVLLKTRGQKYPVKCENPVAVRVGADWNIKFCWQVKKEWNKKLLAEYSASQEEERLDKAKVKKAKKAKKPERLQEVVDKIKKKASDKKRKKVVKMDETVETAIYSKDDTEVTDSSDEEDTLIAFVNSVSDLMPGCGRKCTNTSMSKSRKSKDDDETSSIFSGDTTTCGSVSESESESDSDSSMSNTEYDTQQDNYKPIPQIKLRKVVKSALKPPVP